MPYALTRLILFPLIFTLSIKAVASPWINPGDERTRHHLQVLVDSGLINTPLTTWPLMWNSVKTDIDNIDTQDLSDAQIWSYNYIAHELRKKMEPAYTESRSYLGNATAPFSDFSSDARSNTQLNTSITLTGDRVAAKLAGTYVKNPHDLKEARLDGSYLATLWGNWAIGIGSIDRWWGPNWQSSLILSHNARPSPGLFITRSHSAPFDWPILKYLGPWQLTTFMNQLESKRHVPDAKLWGMRVNFRPLKSLEIGLSRTAMWSGEDRPSDLSTFQNLLLGNDNIGDSGTDESNEPGNQLGGIDFRWSQNLGRVQTAMYAQFIGEDEAGGTPSRGIASSGAEITALVFNIQHRVIIENQNTTMSFYNDNHNGINTAYEHERYRSGYRYYGKPIGSSFDNDSEVSTLKGEHYFENGHSFSWRYSDIKINQDNSPVGRSPGNNVFGNQRKDLKHISIAYKKPLSPRLFMELGLKHYSEEFSVYDQEVDSGAYITLNTHW